MKPVNTKTLERYKSKLEAHNLAVLHSNRIDKDFVFTTNHGKIDTIKAIIARSNWRGKKTVVAGYTIPVKAVRTVKRHLKDDKFIYTMRELKFITQFRLKVCKKIVETIRDSMQS